MAKIKNQESKSTVKNREAVSSKGKEVAPPVYGIDLADTPVLQFKKEKEELPGKKRVQTRLKVGKPGDPFEREADVIADQVMQMRPDVQFKGKLEEEEQKMVQPKSTNSIADAPPGLDRSLGASQGKGSALPPNTLNFMNQAFGTDFSEVRIHHDSEAVQMNQQVSAKAFTHGRDVFFNQGEYQPESSGGQRLLAHELVHVVQQGGGGEVVQKDDKTSTKKVNTQKAIDEILKDPTPKVKIILDRIDEIPDAGTGQVDRTDKGEVSRKDPDTDKWEKDIELEKAKSEKVVDTIAILQTMISQLTVYDLRLDGTDQEPIVNAFRAELYKKLNKKTIYYSQKVNMELLMPPLTWKNTCNMTSLAMGLNGLGISQKDFTGDERKLKKIAEVLKVSDYKNLRMPDFLQLVAVYNAPSLNGKDFDKLPPKKVKEDIEYAKSDAVNKGEKYPGDVYKITYDTTVISIAKLFGVSVKRHYPFTKDEKISLAVYKERLTRKVNQFQGKGAQIVATTDHGGHYVRLQEVTKDGFIIDDPYHKGNNALLEWSGALSVEFGALFIILEK